MNKQRKMVISKLVTEILNLKDNLDTITQGLSNILDEENDARDNMPENLENSQRYYDSEEASDILEESIDELEDIQEQLDSVADQLNELG